MEDLQDDDIGINARTLQTLDWDVVLRALADRARTPLGQRIALLPDFARSRAEALDRYAAVAEVLRLEVDEGLSIPVGAVSDIVDILSAAVAGNVLESHQLREVGACMAALSRLRRWIDDKRAVAPMLRVLAEPITVDADVQSTLERSFDEAGNLSDRMYPQLSDFRTRIRQLSARIQSILSEMIGSDGLGSMLQDRFVTERAGRYVLPLKVGYRRSVGIVHGTSQSGETVYVEPLAVVEHTNELKEAEAALQRELRRILAELSRSVAVSADDLTTSLEAAVEIDLAVARARLGAHLRGTIPEVGVRGTLLLRRARHAVLTLRGVDVVGNDLALDRNHPGLVLTGPNAGGKTVALKTLGLSALMVRAGIPLPVADGSRADFFDHITADIGDLQTVEGDLSTFSGHLSSLKTVLARSGQGSLVLLDEVGMGTDPSQGAALAQAVAQTVLDQGALLALTTHYSRLKELPSTDARFRVGAVRFVDGNPTYHFDLGLVGESHAIAIARRLAFPAAVLERARTLLDAGERRVELLVARLEEEQASLRAAQSALEHAQHALGQEREVLEFRARRLEERRRTLEEDLAREFRGRIRAHEEEVKALIAALQDNPEMKLAGQTLKQIRRLRDEVLPARPPEEAPPPPAPEDLRVGERVQLRTLGSRGIIERILGDDRFEVAVGPMKMRVSLEELVEGEPILQHREDAAERRRRKEAQSRVQDALPLEIEVEATIVGVRTLSNTCDLRGKRLQEAIDFSEQFLDGLLRRNEHVGYILHGHGTGVLKKAIREWLPHAAVVRRWRPAFPQEGGDAYTLVELR